MITSVRGTLESAGPNWVAVSLGSITLQVFVPPPMIEELGPVGSRVKLFTYLQVKEDGLALYGFTGQEARAMFETLITVKGIGPRLALNLLSYFKPEALASTIAAGDVAALSKVHGVGKKTAGRIILELKGKLEEQAITTAIKEDDAMAALLALGYSAAEARDALSKLPSDVASGPLEERVRQALQRLARG